MKTYTKEEVDNPMIYSMTGYGRCEIEEKQRKVTIEISSVNHRYLDLNIRMPRTLTHLEDSVRKTVKQKVARGKLEISIFCHSTAEEDVEIIINDCLCKGYVEGLKKIGEAFQLENDIKLSHLIGIDDLIAVQKRTGNNSEVSGTLDKALKGALETLTQMREAEGAALKADVLEKNETLKQLVEAISERSALVTVEYKRKLEARLAVLLENVTIDPNRLATEVALFADKCAIDEELTRLRSHMVQLEKILDEESIAGRKLDFLMQEMNREANTIGSKANHYEITKYVVELKTEIEKIREQVQNIE